MPGLLLGWLYRRWAVKQFEATGQLAQHVLGTPGDRACWPAWLGWALGGAPTAINRPFKGEFAIENGGALTPEFLAVLLGLTLYTAAFVAEVVRGGIQSVARGQARSGRRRWA